MKITIFPNKLKGTIKAPSSKSITHRALICASFSKGISTIYHPLVANDTIETINALKNLGASINLSSDKIVIEGIKSDFNLPLTFKESASSLRMILPYLLFIRGQQTINLNDALIKRLTSEELAFFDYAHIDYKRKTLTCAFNFDKKVYNINDNVTSQWSSGFLLLLPLLENKLLKIDESLLDNSYLTLTQAVMALFNIKLHQEGSLFTTTSTYQSTTITVEGDWSNASLWFVLNYLGADIEVTNLSKDSLQGDKEIKNIIQKLKKDTNLSLDLSYNLDLAVIVAAAAALRPGVTTLKGLRRLANKESNRYQAILDILKAFGIKAIGQDDEITIIGVEKLKGGLTIDSYNDHRIIMAIFVLASKCEMPITILQAESINKSYPSLYEDYLKLGGLLKKE